jgi:hypothetical protein
MSHQLSKPSFIDTRCELEAIFSLKPFKDFI